MSRVSKALGAAALVLALSWSVYAATDTKTLTINASVLARATLTLSASTISFGAADPGSTPSISSSPASIDVTAKAQATKGSTVYLKCKANGDLVTPGDSDSIGIGNVTWTATGTGFASSGTMVKTTDVGVATWTGSGEHTGSLNFFLANSWDYGVGEYSQTVTYTLTAL
jgi:hypothetical protein